MITPDLIAALCIAGLLVTFLVAGLCSLRDDARKAVVPQEPDLIPSRIATGRAQLRVLQRKVDRRHLSPFGTDQEPPVA